MKLVVSVRNKSYPWAAAAPPPALAVCGAFRRGDATPSDCHLRNGFMIIKHLFPIATHPQI